MEKFVDDEVYPVKFSAGGINAYYVDGCEQVGHRPAYCVCVNKVQHYLRNNSLKDSPCEAPIRGGSCVALRMRKEELSKGRAIYFIHREKMQAHIDAQKAIDNAAKTAAAAKRGPMVYPKYVQDQIDASRAKQSLVPLTPEAPKPSSVLDSIDDSGYAKAITVAIAAEIKPEPGESFVEMARRALAAKQSPQE